MSVGSASRSSCSEAKLADKLGFDYYFTAEHHFSQRLQPVAVPALTNTILAQRDRTHPVRADDGHPADRRPTPHRRGVHDHRPPVRWPSRNGCRPRRCVPRARDLRPPQRRWPALFRENLEFLIKCWTNEENFSWNGVYHQYFDIEMPWKPLQQPHPRIWIPTATPDNAKEWGRRGYGVGGFSWLGIDIHKDIFAAYQEGLGGERATGRGPTHCVPVVLRRGRHRCRGGEAGQRSTSPNRSSSSSTRRAGPTGSADTNLKRVYSGLLNLFDQIKNVDEVSGPAQMIIHGSPETVAEKMLS